MDAERPARILPVIVLSQFAGTSLWFAGNAVLPDLQRELALGAHAVGTITSAVQLGFIAGTLVFAFLNVSDRHSPRAVFLACALLGACANAAVILAPGLPHPLAAILALRFATGFFLAGIYPVGMKIAAGWYPRGLGGALGFLVGALVLGTAFPHLLKGLGQALAWGSVLAWLSALAAAGGVMMFALVPDGPYLAKGVRFDPHALRSIFASPSLRAAAFGYFGHMWELYTLWAFMPLMIAGYAAMNGHEAVNVGVWSFVVIAAGALGCVGGGIISHRAGSARVAFAQLAASGLCCLLSPLAYLLPWPGFAAFLFAWGVFVVGDSPQFSALTAATAPKAFVGSALTIVNCIGFAITVVSIEAATALSMRIPIQWWFVPVAIGPIFGLLAFRRMLAAPIGAAVESDAIPTFFRSPAEFRRWLERHHDTTAFLWLGFWKKASGRPGITYDEAVDEAICFGWIDGLVKSHGAASYRHRFTPRKRGSIWSAINIDRAERLKKAGRMEKAGLAAYDGRHPDRARLYSFENRHVRLDAALAKRFRAQRAAWKFFSAQPPGYRRVAEFWVMNAKREETRARRLAKLIEDCAAGRRLASIAGKPPSPPRPPRTR